MLQAQPLRVRVLAAVYATVIAYRLCFRFAIGSVIVFSLLIYLIRMIYDNNELALSCKTRMFPLIGFTKITTYK